MIRNHNKKPVAMQMTKALLERDLQKIKALHQSHPDTPLLEWAMKYWGDYWFLKDAYHVVAQRPEYSGEQFKMYSAKNRVLQLAHIIMGEGNIKAVDAGQVLETLKSHGWVLSATDKMALVQSSLHHLNVEGMRWLFKEGETFRVTEAGGGEPEEASSLTIKKIGDLTIADYLSKGNDSGIKRRIAFEFLKDNKVFGCEADQTDPTALLKVNLVAEAFEVMKIGGIPQGIDRGTDYLLPLVALLSPDPVRGRNVLRAENLLNQHRVLDALEQWEHEGLSFNTPVPTKWQRPSCESRGDYDLYVKALNGCLKGNSLFVKKAWGVLVKNGVDINRSPALLKQLAQHWVIEPGMDMDLLNEAVRLGADVKKFSGPIFAQLAIDTASDAHQCLWWEEFERRGASSAYVLRSVPVEDHPIAHAVLKRVFSLARVALDKGVSPVWESTGWIGDHEGEGYGATLLHLLAPLCGKEPLALLARVMKDSEVKGQINQPLSTAWGYADQGDTPLHMAAYELNLSVIECLLKEGANPNLVNEKGYTALHTAARKYGKKSLSKAPRVIRALLAAGVDPTLKNKEGLTAGQMMAKLGPLEALEPLLMASPSDMVSDDELSRGIKKTLMARGLAAHSLVEKVELLEQTAEPFRSLESSHDEGLLLEDSLKSNAYRRKRNAL